MASALHPYRASSEVVGANEGKKGKRKKKKEKR
jgi:hypothetical protein